jgi:hypothetical protein
MLPYYFVVGKDYDERFGKLGNCSFWGEVEWRSEIEMEWTWLFGSGRSDD